MQGDLVKMDLLLQARIDGIFFNPHRPEGIDLRIQGKENLRFSLRPRDPKEDASGMYRGLVCQVCYTVVVDQDIVEFVSAYIAQKIIRVSSDVALPRVHKDGHVLIDSEGNFANHYHPTKQDCPEDIRGFIESWETKLTELAERFLKLLRWRQGVDAKADLIENKSLYWRIDQGPNYHGVPLNRDGTWSYSYPGLNGLHWSPQHEEEVANLWNEQELVEPLGHALLREAACAANESPKSAILIMTAALETAVKMHVSKIAPSTAWLMEEAPSPPIFKILRDYIKILHAGQGKDVSFWDALLPLFKAVHKLIEVRNKVAHTGKIPPDSPAVKDSILLVTDVLYILDVLDGREWAKSRVSSKLRDALGWPKPITHPYSISAKAGRN